MLHCNVISHWLSPYPESSLISSCHIDSSQWKHSRLSQGQPHCTRDSLNIQWPQESQFDDLVTMCESVWRPFCSRFVHQEMLIYMRWSPLAGLFAQVMRYCEGLCLGLSRLDSAYTAGFVHNTREYTAGFVHNTREYTAGFVHNTRECCNIATRGPFC